MSAPPSLLRIVTPSAMELIPGLHAGETAAIPSVPKETRVSDRDPAPAPDQSSQLEGALWVMPLAIFFGGLLGLVSGGAIADTIRRWNSVTVDEGFWQSLIGAGWTILGMIVGAVAGGICGALLGVAFESRVFTRAKGPSQTAQIQPHSKAIRKRRKQRKRR
jgi:hypothetical protein